MDNLHVKPLETTQSLTVLEGKALEEQRFKPLVISGDIDTVREYLSKRFNKSETEGFDGGPALRMLDDKENLQFVDPCLAVIVANKNPEKASIKLLLDPNHPQGTEVTAFLEKSDELKKFHINEAYDFSRESLMKLIRFNRRYFSNPDQYEKLFFGLNRLRITSKDEVVKEKDTRGNFSTAHAREVDSSSIPETVSLSMPIFKNQARRIFGVQIGINKTEGAITFNLESVELDELITDSIDEIFKFQLGSFKEDFVIVNL